MASRCRRGFAALALAVTATYTIGCVSEEGPASATWSGVDETDGEAGTMDEVGDLDAGGGETTTTAEPPEPEPEPEPEPKPNSSTCSFPLVWPTTNSDTIETIVNDAYGPRLLGEDFDWHRGVDLPGHPDGVFADPAFAAASGRIYAIGNRPNPNQGALSGFGSTAGNVIILEHTPADLDGLAAQTIYTVYMHLDTIDLAHFMARIGGEQVEVDLREYFHLDGPDTKADNRGRPRSHFKTSGEVIDEYPRVQQHDALAIIGDTGANYEHLHFEVREGDAGSEQARNPYAYLPHLDLAMQQATLSATVDGLRAVIEIPREPGSLGATTDLAQQLDVEDVALQLRDADDQLVDELRVSFLDIGTRAEPDSPSFELEGAFLTLSPDDFNSSDAIWRLTIDYQDLDVAGLSPGPGERWVLEVGDLCGNRVLAEL